MSADDKDQKDARKLLIVLLLIALLLVAAVALLVPAISDFVQTSLEPGVGVKSAAIISFFVTVLTLAFFAITAGDGLLGELQFMLAGFFSFFLMLWFMIAWIF